MKDNAIRKKSKWMNWKEIVIHANFKRDSLGPAVFFLEYKL